MRAELTMLRYDERNKGPYLDTVIDTPFRLYEEWFENLSCSTRRHIWLERFGLIFPDPETQAPYKVGRVRSG
ncbi:MAG TPA: hypothetical protein VMW42_10825 [Desulfatiglandales bacterium]|nr:hypothetical protein [Desulfatiglandales bacterium]